MMEEHPRSEKPVDGDSVREEFESWLHAHWDKDASLLQWRQELVDAGWSTPSWPAKWYGRDLPGWAESVIASTITGWGIVGRPLGSGPTLVAPTLLMHASDSLRERLIRPALTGEARFCQLFSEPDAGSDLKALSSRADWHGDGWTVNGQKVWTSGATGADYGILLARTKDGPQSRITAFVLPMKQAGVRVRPLRQMNDHSTFNEVFLTEAVIPAANLLGDLHDGWRIAMTILGNGRNSATTQLPDYRNGDGRIFGEAQAEVDEQLKTYSWYPQREGRVDLIFEREQESQKYSSATARQAASRAFSLERIRKWTGQRAEERRLSGRTPGPEAAIAKLGMSRVAQEAAVAHTAVAGPAGMLAGPEAPLHGIITEVLLSTPAQSIAGGTDEIQKNVVAEKVLGLPPEPKPM